MKYIFETKHLGFRCFEPSDAQQLYENHLELEMKEWFPTEIYEDISEAEEAIEFFSDCVNKKELPYVFAIELKENGKLIGDTGVNEVAGSNGDEVEIGYSISNKYSGKGYATEAVLAMTNYISETFKIRILYGRVMKGNIASVRVMEKAGFHFLMEEFGAEDDPFGKGMLVYKRELKFKKIQNH